MNMRPFDTVDIIGFASTVDSPALPRILPPIYQDRLCPGEVLLPPMTVLDSAIIGVASPLSSLSSHSGNLTIFEKKIPARPSHSLWLDPDGVVRYQSSADVKKTFSTLFTAYLNLADSYLKTSSAQAKRNAEVAHALNPHHIEPLVILGCLAKMRRSDKSYYDYICHLSLDCISLNDFDLLVNSRYLRISAKNT